MRLHNSIVICVATLAITASTALAVPEICGNGVDDNSNGMSDEGCWPAEAL